MSFFEMFGQLGVFALVTVAMAFLPLVVAAVYAAAPSERRLALLRPISLAAIFSALTGLFNGGIAVLRGIARTPVLDREAWSAIAMGALKR